MTVARNVPVALALTLGAVGCSTHPTAIDRVVFAPDPAPQDSAPQSASRDRRPVSVPIGVGFTADPDTFAISAAADFEVAPDWTAGPAVLLGLDDRRTLIAPTLQAKRHFQLGREDDPDLSRLSAFVQGGVGIAYIEKERRNQSDLDDVGLLLNAGGGLRYRVSDGASLGTQMMFNVMPDDVADEHFFFSWDVVQFVLEF